MHTYHRYSNRNYIVASFLGFVAAMLSGCSSDSTGPIVGTMEITVSTTGVKPTLEYDIYTVRVNGATTYTVGLNTVLTLPNMTPGNYSVRLDGIANNCRMDTANPSTVSVVLGDAVSEVYFQVVCANPPPDDDGCGWYDYDCSHAIATAGSMEVPSRPEKRSVSGQTSRKP